MPKIHNTAIVDPAAKLADDVEVGPYSVIGKDAEIGAGVKIMSHVVIDGWTRIGEKCQIFPFASLGTQCQDLKYKGAKTLVSIGDRTIIREYVTVNGATDEGETTSVGSDCFIMAYCHIAHACHVGNQVIMANLAQLAGHVEVADMAILGAMAGFHQFTRVGRMCMIGGCSRISQDCPPFMLVEGNPPSIVGPNSVGLRRRGMSEDTRRSLKNAHRLLCREGLSTTQAVERIRTELGNVPEVAEFLTFIEGSERGVTK